MENQMGVCSFMIFFFFFAFRFVRFSMIYAPSIVVSPLEIDIPVLVKIHIVALGSPKELDVDLFKILAKKSFGGVNIIDLPQNAHLVKHTFESLANVHCIHTHTHTHLQPFSSY
jgi:hypothetical protein